LQIAKYFGIYFYVILTTEYLDSGALPYYMTIASTLYKPAYFPNNTELLMHNGSVVDWPSYDLKLQKRILGKMRGS